MDVVAATKRISLPEEDETSPLPPRLMEVDQGRAMKRKEENEATPPGEQTNHGTEPAMAAEKGDWTVEELQTWAARLGARERALAAREVELDRRAAWLDAQQAPTPMLE